MGEPDAKYAGHPGATSNFGPPGSTGTGGGGGYGNSGSGYGESPSNGGYGNNSNSGGFGNPNFVDARTEKTWLQKASQLAASAASALPGFNTSETKEPLQSNNFSNNGFSQQRSSGTFNRAAFSNPEANSGTFNRAAFSNPEGAAGGGYNYATNRGPNAIHNNASPYAPQAYPPAAATQNSAWQQQQQGAPLSPTSGGMVPDMPVCVSGVGRAGGALSNGAYEKNMIDSLCEPAGLRPVPPEDKLEELLNTASTLSDDIIGNCLMDVLNEESWQSRTKALIVIAKLVKTPDCAAHLQWWQDRVDVVEAMLSDTKANVRTQAHKTLRAIDPNAASGPPPANTAAPSRRVSAGRSGFAPTTVAPIESTAPSMGQYNADNASEMATTISEDEGTKLSDNMADEAHETVPEPIQLAPSPPPPAPVVANLLEMDDLEVPSPMMMTASAPTGVAVAPIPSIPAPPAPVSIPTEVMVTTQPPVSPLGCGKDSSGDLVNTGTDDADSLFAGMSVGGSETAPAVVAVPPVAPTAVATAGMPVQTQSEAVNIFDFLDSSIPTPPAPAPVQAAAVSNQASELDIFGSMVISNHNATSVPVPVPVPAAPVPAGMVPPVGGQQVYMNQFAGLMDPVPAAAVAPGTLTPEQQQQQYQQYMFQQQQQYYAMQAQQGQQHPQGLHLTRPVPMPTAPGQTAYNYAYPPRGGPMPGSMPAGVPAGAGGRPMMMYAAGGQGMSPPPQQPIQLRQGSSIIAPGMLAHTAERKTIPDAPGNRLLLLLYLLLYSTYKLTSIHCYCNILLQYTATVIYYYYTLLIY